MSDIPATGVNLSYLIVGTDENANEVLNAKCVKYFREALVESVKQKGEEDQLMPSARSDYSHAPSRTPSD